VAEIIDYGRFSERLARPAQRWELLREFQQEWGYEPSDGPRWSRWTGDEHREYVAALRSEVLGVPDSGPLAGVDLALAVPKALDEWWDLPFNSFTDRFSCYETNPVWPPTVRPDPSGYGVSDGLPGDSPFLEPGQDRRVCVFMAENQYCNEWGYPAAWAAQDDPAVLVSALDEDGKEAWLPQSRSISEFFVQLAATRLPAHYGWTVWDEPPGLVERMRGTLPSMGFLPWRELGAHGEFFGGPDTIVYHNVGDGGEFTAYGRSHEALERLGHTLGVDWSESICEPESLTASDGGS
jgi:hypothetical protein